MAEHRDKLGLVSRFKVLRGCCPECGGCLERVIATNESYTRSVSVMTRPMDSLARSAFPSRQQVQVTPVYSVCKTCGFRVRRKDIKTPV
ncbi:MAG: hypothetical protein U9N00_05865 [Candidatus Bipolaricaulota bacterium]|nr:hypothetical protein [Candidatus Bipolaricaulota bacterium]